MFHEQQLVWHGWKWFSLTSSNVFCYHYRNVGLPKIYAATTPYQQKSGSDYCYTAVGSTGSRHGWINIMGKILFIFFPSNIATTKSPIALPAKHCTKFSIHTHTDNVVVCVICDQVIQTYIKHNKITCAVELNYSSSWLINLNPFNMQYFSVIIFHSQTSSIQTTTTTKL